MVDVQAQIEYWRASSVEDWEVANELVRSSRVRHGLFFAHLALEKMLKAHVCRTSCDVAPRLHSLLRLAERAGLALSDEQRLFLARFDRFQMEGRYHDPAIPAVSVDVAQAELRRAGEFFEWLTRQL